MPSYNHVTLMGNLTRDPELRYTPGGTAVCDLGLAVNRRWTDKNTNEKKEEVSFLDCVVWARGAEVIAQYCKKGSSILVDGELRQERWQDKESGANRSKIKVHIKSFQFVGGKKDNGAQQGGGDAPPADIPF
jgi:single-strand DNA-binding protein